jgi:hypothetical protein
MRPARASSRLPASIIQSHAGLETERFDTAHHRAVPADRDPGGATQHHAKREAPATAPRAPTQHLLDFHQLLDVEPVSKRVPPDNRRSLRRS